MNNIDKVFVINLEHRTERLTNFMKEMDKVGLTDRVERINAIYTPEFGILGCTKSHILTLEKIINSNYNNVIVFEDDFRFYKSEFAKMYLELLNEQIPNLDYDIISFSANDKWAGDYKVESCNYSFLKKGICLQTSSGYLITRDFANILKTTLEEGVKLLESTKNRDLYGIDMYWKRLQPISKWYITEPILGYQEPGYSDIENKIVEYNC